MRYIFLVNGWPTLATQATRHRYILDGVFVGAYDDEEDLRREFYQLLTVAQRNVASSVFGRPPSTSDPGTA